MAPTRTLRKAAASVRSVAHKAASSTYRCPLCKARIKRPGRAKTRAGFCHNAGKKVRLVRVKA